jgi:ATP-binding cassette, subfamily B, bacterial
VPSTSPAPAGESRMARRLMFDVTRRSPLWLATMFLAEFGGVLTTMLVPYLLAGAVDDVLGGRGGAAALARLAGALMVDLAFGVLGTLAGAYVMAGATAWLRRRLVDRLMALGVAGPRAYAPGDLTSRLITDTQQTAMAGPDLLGQVIGVATAGGGVVALWLIDWRLVVAFAAGVPLTWLAVRLLVTEVSGLFVQYSRVLGEIAARLSNALSGARTIRACGTVEIEARRVLDPLPEISSLGYGMWQAQRRGAVQLGLVVPLIRIAVLATAGFGVAAGRISPGQFVAVGAYIGLALGALDATGGLIDLAQARAGAQRVAEVLSEVPPPRGGGLPPAGPGALALRNVTVRGARGQAILDGLDLDLPPGRSLALVGGSGAGKTTVAFVAGGLIRPDTGHVLLDGIPLAALAPDALRQAVSYAFARPHLLGTTVADAIGFGHRGASRSRIEHAARIAHADGFVRRLPEGYDTPLAQAPLSGGEVQRLGLARAVSGDAQLIILDDATSSLDTATEAQVSVAMTDRLAGRTRLIVTHRAATAARADLVAWLADGRIRALAPHADLWRDPAYRAAFGAGER